MHTDLTQGPVMKTMLRFAVPMILGNLLQQCYNIADTLIVGKFLGADALAAVGSAFSLMTFLTSILQGLAKRNRILHPIRAKGSAGAEGGDPGFVFPSWHGCDPFECRRLCRAGLDHMGPSYPGGAGRHDAGIFSGHLRGAGRDLPV